jgi:hypothetical protein
MTRTQLIEKIQDAHDGMKKDELKAIVKATKGTEFDVYPMDTHDKFAYWEVIYMLQVDICKGLFQ